MLFQTQNRIQTPLFPHRCVTQSVTKGMPTQSIGTIVIAQTSIVPHA